MSHETDSRSAHADRGPGQRGGDGTTELLLGVFRDVQLQSARLTEQARELALLRMEAGDHARANVSALAASRSDAADERNKAADERNKLAQALEELRIEARSGVQSSGRAQRELELRFEALDARLGVLEADLKHERARLSEVYNEVNGMQDKVVRSAVRSTDARASAGRAVWLATLALLAVLWAVGQAIWPALQLAF